MAYASSRTATPAASTPPAMAYIPSPTEGKVPLPVFFLDLEDVVVVVVVVWLGPGVGVGLAASAMVKVVSAVPEPDHDHHDDHVF